MTSVRSSLFLLLLLVLFCGPAVARPQSVTLHYEIHLGGFFAGAVDLEVGFSDDSYALTALVRSRGPIDWIIGFTSRAESIGRIAERATRPLRHRADNVWMGEERWVRATYDQDGHVEATHHPSAEDDGRDAVPGDDVNGSLDPLSAALSAALLATDAQPCSGILPVFDGRRRYDLALTDVGPAEYQSQVYKGPSRRCRAELRRIAGFSRRPWLPAIKGAESADVWFARLGDALPLIPVAIEADTGLGVAVVRLVRVDAAEP